MKFLSYFQFQQNAKQSRTTYSKEVKDTFKEINEIIKKKYYIKKKKLVVMERTKFMSLRG